jgi:hypothetical protein
VSDSVGGPINVLTLDENGLHWEPTEGGTCSPEETETPTKPQTLSPNAERSPGREHLALFAIDKTRQWRNPHQSEAECGFPVRSKQRKRVLA